MRTMLVLLVAVALRDDLAPLFNGKDLSGWEAVGGPADCWAWQDGKVVCKGGKGGVFIRAPREGHTSKVGMEIQILDDDAEIHKNIKPFQHTASIYGVVAP